MRFKDAIARSASISNAAKITPLVPGLYARSAATTMRSRFEPEEAGYDNGFQSWILWNPKRTTRSRPGAAVVGEAFSCCRYGARPRAPSARRDLVELNLLIGGEESRGFSAACLLCRSIILLRVASSGDHDSLS